MSEIKDYAIKCFQDEAQAILDLIPLLTDDFDKAIDLIYHSRGKLARNGRRKIRSLWCKDCSYFGQYWNTFLFY